MVCCCNSSSLRQWYYGILYALSLCCCVAVPPCHRLKLAAPMLHDIAVSKLMVVPQIIALQELKLQTIAKGLVCPGFTIFFSNLLANVEGLTKRETKEAFSANEDKWMKEYFLGALDSLLAAAFLTSLYCSAHSGGTLIYTIYSGALAVLCCSSSVLRSPLAGLTCRHPHWSPAAHLLPTCSPAAHLNGSPAAHLP